MATKQLGWLIALLIATPSFFVACGGDDSSSGTTGSPTSTGTAGTGGSTGTGGATGTGGGGTGGSGGSPDGSAGSSGSAGKGGSDAGLVDGRIPCGTVMNGCNPNGMNNVCDMVNNRCVQCLSNTDCASQTNNKICDLTPTGMNMLPRGVCVACTDTSQCPSGATCTNGNCYMPCGTVMNGCNTNPTGNNICDAPNNRCVDCLNDGDCAVETTNKHCDTSLNTAGLPRDACEECLDNSHCMTGQLCVNNNCEASCTTDDQCASDSGFNRTPHCNPTTHVCAECGSDAHCMGTTPICIPAGTCEQCTTDAHCAATPNTPYCRTASYTCVQCLTSDQCTAPQTCNGQGRCTGGTTDGGGRGEGGMTPPEAGGGG